MIGNMYFAYNIIIHLEFLENWLRITTQWMTSLFFVTIIIILISILMLRGRTVASSLLMIHMKQLKTDF